MKFLTFLCMAGMAFAAHHTKTHHARIIGGEQVLPGDVRFMAAVENGPNLLPFFECGGIILNANTILTGDKCGTASNFLPNILHSRVRVGSLKRGQGGQRIVVSKKTVVGRMAVLKLVSPINMTDPQVSAINLYSGQVQTGWRVNTAGWGSQDGVGTVVDLQKVTQVRVRTDDVCNNNYGIGYNPTYLFCAGFYSGACGEYDFGGPAYLNNGQLAGIVGPGDCNPGNIPRFYWKVFPYLSEIQALMNAP